jgi:signal transduction histidine kinase
VSGSRERRAIVVAAALVVEGILTVRVGFASFELRQGVLALLSGWIVGGAGLLAWVRAPSSRTGPLLIVVAAAWSLASLQRTSIELLDDIAGLLGLVYAAVLAHTILAFPTGRLPGTVMAVLVVATYAASLVPLPTGAILVGATLAIGLALGSMVSRPGSILGRPAAASGLLFAAALVFGTVVPWLSTGGSALDMRPAIEIALAIVAITLSAVLVNTSDRRLHVTDLVVELGPEAGGNLARQLAAAVGDRTLEVGYWLADQGRYVDATGREVVIPAPGSGRGMTLINRAGRPVALLTHDPATSADPGVRSAIARAAELSAANARLQAGVRTQLVEVDASRRRLLDAVDEERRELRTRLSDDLGPRLASLEAALAEAGPGLDGDDGALDAIGQLRETRREVVELADGLRPRALDERGLAGALDDLARRSPLPVEVEIDTVVDSSPASQTAVYFVCSEALANAAKHADASSIAVRLRRVNEDLVLEIEDDGIGGADARRGSGLQGLRDRVEALGGSLAIASDPGQGTRLVASVPAGHEPAPPSRESDGAGRGQAPTTGSWSRPG